MNLIWQDHIVSAVLLTKKDTFLTFDEFNHLVYCSGVYARQSGSFVSKPGKKVSILDSADEILQLPCPAIIRPEPLWTGKQVVYRNRRKKGLFDKLVEHFNANRRVFELSAFDNAYTVFT